MILITVGGGNRSRRIGEQRETWESTTGNLSDRTALENCGFELACTISRWLSRPFCVQREMGKWIHIGGSRGSKGTYIQAHIEAHPRYVSELSANRMSASHRRHHLPRCDVHSKERDKSSVTELSWCMGEKEAQPKVQDNKDEGYALYFDPIS